MTRTGCSKSRRQEHIHACFEDDVENNNKILERSRRQLVKGDFGVCEICICLYVVARRELKKNDFEVRDIYVNIFKQVGIRGNTLMKL